MTLVEFLSRNLENTKWISNDESVKITLKDIMNIINRNRIKVKNFPVSKIKGEANRLLRKGGIKERGIEKADLNEPIVLLDMGRNNIKVLDGNHRLIKAIRERNDKIKSYVLPIGLIPEKYHKIFK